MSERADEKQRRRARQRAEGRRAEGTPLAGQPLTRRRLLQAGLGASGLALFAACAPASPPREAPGPAPQAQGGGTAPAAQTGGQIVFSSGSEPLTMNPAFGTSSDTIYMQQFLFDGLTRPDDNLRPMPSLAESWDVGPGGMSYTFHLRRGVKFHDGREMTANDVKFTWELINHQANKAANYTFFARVKGAEAYRAGAAPEISGITAPDDYTVHVEMEAPYAPFLSISAFFPIMPKHVYSVVPPEELDKHPTARNPVGTGPFKFTEWRPADSFIMDVHRDYWGGRAKLDRLIVKHVPDPTTLPSLLRSGTVDLVGLYRGVAAVDYDSFAKDSNFRLKEMPGYSNWHVEFNLTNPVFQDIRVRRGLIHAVDREGIVKGFLLGHGQIADTPIHPSSWAYTPPKLRYEYNPDKAKALFREAGWTPGPDGILVKDGQRFSFELATFLPDYPELLQEQWRQVGVECRIKRSDFAGFWAPVYLARKHEAAGLHMILGIYTDPEYPLPSYFSSRLNRNGYRSPKVDELIQKATATLDQDERKKLYAEFLEQLVEDAPHMWIAMPNETWGMNTKVRLPDKRLGFLMITNAKDWERVG
jgi:peptide/nickel transport system substrate-binding protein